MLPRAFGDVKIRSKLGQKPQRWPLTTTDCNRYRDTKDAYNCYQERVWKANSRLKDLGNRQQNAAFSCTDSQTREIGPKANDYSLKSDRNLKSDKARVLGAAIYCLELLNVWKMPPELASGAKSKERPCQRPKQTVTLTSTTLGHTFADQSTSKGATLVGKRWERQIERLLHLPSAELVRAKAGITATCHDLENNHDV